VKKIYSLATVLIALVIFSSCKKEYECACKVTYIVDGKQVNTDYTNNTIRAVNKDDAGKQCVYYEREEDYLQQKAIVRYNCALR